MTCLVLVFENTDIRFVWFLFLKTVLYSQEQGELEKYGKHVGFRQTQRTQKTLNQENKNRFHRTPK